MQVPMDYYNNNNYFKWLCLITQWEKRRRL